MKINKILIQKIDRILLVFTIVLTCLLVFNKEIDYIYDIIGGIVGLLLLIMYAYQYLKSICGIILFIIHRKKITSYKNEIDYLPYIPFITCMFIILIMFISKTLGLRVTIDTPELLNSLEKGWAIYIASMLVTTIGISS